MTDNNGTLVWSWEAKPFGDSAPNEAPDGDGVKVGLNLRFPGQYYDQETGLYYNYYRYYDPETGRYITSDPIGLAGGLNTYAYVGGNPLNYTDSQGLAYSPNGEHSMPPKASFGRCNEADKQYCRNKCGCNGWLRCVVRKTPKFRVAKGPMTGYENEREVLCECADDDPSPSQFTSPNINPLWLIFIFLVPPFGVPG